jgi:hypothetical protein
MYGMLERTSKRGIGFPRPNPQLELAEGIFYVAHTAVNYTLGSTIPSRTKAGDLIVACLFNRASSVTIPTGWTQVAVQVNSSSTQWTFVLYKIATEYDAGGAVNFGSITGRAAISISVYRCTTGFEVEQYATFASDTPQVPAVTSGGDYRMAICVNSAYSISGGVMIIYGSTWTPISAYLTSDCRMAVSFVMLNSGSLPSSAVTDPGAGACAGITVLFKPA